MRYWLNYADSKIPGLRSSGDRCFADKLASVTVRKPRVLCHQIAPQPHCADEGEFTRESVKLRPAASVRLRLLVSMRAACHPDLERDRSVGVFWRISLVFQYFFFNTALLQFGSF
jgi:hypothetical protein